MRFVVYLVLIGVLVFFTVALFQVLLKRVTDRDRVRASDLAILRADYKRAATRIQEVQAYCDNAALVNDTDLTALNVLNILRRESK